MNGMISYGKNIKRDKQKHAYATFAICLEQDNLTEEDWKAALDKTLEIQQYISDQVYISRKKDFDNPFRHTTFRNKAEMKAVHRKCRGQQFHPAGKEGYGKDGEGD